MSNTVGLFCQKCEKMIPESQFQLVCPECGSPLFVRYDLEKLKVAISRMKSDFIPTSFLSKWVEILPIDQPELIDKVSLGEAQTPLVRSWNLAEKMNISDLYFKIEIGPTLSLKDRGTSLCALKALEMGYDTLCVASSGNNAASVAAYAAKAGIPSVVFIQKDTSPAKISKSLIFGARVVRIDGDMSAASKICGEMLKRHRWMQAGGPNPYRLTAKRTAVYEIYQQLGCQAPDVIIIPCGGSAGMVSAYNGFSEMFEMGLISFMPKMIGVQLEACDPVTRAFDEGRDEATPVEKKPSFSDALMNNNPYWGAHALTAVRKTEGFFISVSDREVADSIRVLGSSEGLFTEPAGAVAFAGLQKSLLEKRLPSFKKAVCMLTGHGLNAPQAVFQTQVLPELVPPDVGAVESYLNM